MAVSITIFECLSTGVPSREKSLRQRCLFIVFFFFFFFFFLTFPVSVKFNYPFIPPFLKRAVQY